LIRLFRNCSCPLYMSFLSFLVTQFRCLMLLVPSHHNALHIDYRSSSTCLPTISDRIRVCWLRWTTLTVCSLAFGIPLGSPPRFYPAFSPIWLSLLPSVYHESINLAKNLFSLNITIPPNSCCPRKLTSITSSYEHLFLPRCCLAIESWHRPQRVGLPTIKLGLVFPRIKVIGHSRFTTNAKFLHLVEAPPFPVYTMASDRKTPESVSPF